MTEQSMFFQNNQKYDQIVFARFLKDVVGHNGVVPGIDNELQVVAHNPTNMGVQVKTGRSWINGYIHEILANPVNLTIADADPSKDRIDRVVLRLNVESPRQIRVAVLKGTPAEGTEQDPVQPPALTQTANIWEESLCKIKVPKNTLTITQDNITDERGFMSFTRANQPKASKTAIGSVKIGDGISVTSDGTISMPYTPFPMMARMYLENKNLGSIIVDNVYNGTFGQPPIGTLIQNAGGATDAKSIDCIYHIQNKNATGPGDYFEYVVTAWNCLTGTSRALHREGKNVDANAHHYFYFTAQCALEEIIEQSVSGPAYHLLVSNEGNTVYIGRPTT